MFLKNKNIIFKIRRSKVTDYAALKFLSSDQPAQWLNIRVFDPRPIQAVASSSITGVTVLCP